MSNNNPFVKETFVNEDHNCIFSESEWYESFTDNLFTLFKSLRKEYGKPSKMYIDSKEGAKQVGWIFSKTDKYEDTKEKYKKSVWVEVAKEQPIKEVKWTISYPEF